VPQSEYERVTEVRVDGPYVSFTDVRDPDIAIYNRETGEVRRLTHPAGGRINDVSVSLKNGDLLYERRKGPVTEPRVYLWRRGESEPTLISNTDTFTPQWAPSGDLFLLRKVQKAGRGDGGSYSYWWIYSSDGKPLLDLSRYGRPSQADWSPDSEKIALEVRSEPLGLFILYIGEDGPSVEVERARYIAPPEEKYLSAPQWSPDGTKLAYTTWQIGAQSGEYTELRLLEDGSYRRYSAGPGSASTFVADPWTWTSPTTLTMPGRSSDSPNPSRPITRVTIQL
jgi:dipeptidyl aminopeptidase/acylaminoacyl peptidase